MSEGEISSRLESFLGERLGPSSRPRVDNVERVAVGRSRENWLFDASWQQDGVEVRESLIVRRDPLGGLLETDRAVEYAVLAALEHTAVPAPAVRWLDAHGVELGRPSLVMVREAGECDYFVLNGDWALSKRVELARRLCALLATVHQADWRRAGLGEVFEDPGLDAATIELARWESILRRDQLEPYPELELALRGLRATAPAAARTVLVHGDFKVGNVLLQGDIPTTLLDWELAHLGDPHEDLGWITQPLRTREHLIAGAWQRQDLLAYYEELTGWTVDHRAVRWWNALACFKTAVMQASGLRAYVEGRCDELYQPTAVVLSTLADLVDELVGEAG